MMWIVWLSAVLAAGIVATAYWGYRTVFYVGKSCLTPVRSVPRGKAFEPYRAAILGNIDRLLALPYEPMSIRSRDGLRLSGRYYAGTPGAPLAIFFHGYRSAAARDGSGGFWYCREKGYGVLLVDQRGHWESEGHTMTFGIREREDCLLWAEEAVRRFGPETRIMLAGVSMGAATVLSASSLPLPTQVKGIWADCGFTTAAGVLRAGMERRRWHAEPLLMLAALGARLFGGFRINESAPLEAVAHTRLPILLIHGEADTVVPVRMAYALRDACASPVTLLTVPGAEHGVSWYVDTAAYRQALDAFCGRIFP